MVGHKSNRTKYNFNLPKRAPDPYGYANDDTMESWEFENNTSNLLLFKSDYFDPTPYVDDEGNVLPNWRKDFEARFPSDAWLDTNILQEFVSFVYSTDRTQATGNALPSSVTYDGVTYTTDSAAYRLAKFKAEFPTYAELDTFIFYYVFTELFLMVDSRAKNLFVGFNGSNVTVSGRKARRKATAQPYDMDTAAGTNNEGSLVFGYSLEDTDHMAGGADIFNGQQSVLWNNLRDSYNTEIVRMYQTLRSNGILSYSNVEQRYEEHQSKWSEAIWMEDAWFKYIDPLINPDAGKEPTAVYLPMMQGSKEEQRKWWMINRFRYMDSKWNAGEALSQVIQLRGYAKANITVTPYADIYPTVKYGSYLVNERGEHDQPTTLVCPIDELNDTEIYIYSAPQLASVGDLSPLKVGFADFSMATRLQSIKIGDSSSNYNNTNLYSLSLGSNVLLKTLDVRNCSGLGDTTMEGHTQTTVDLSGCEIIEEIYFGGTKVTGVSVPNGGVLRVLSLPKTITSLIVRNQGAITTFEVEDDDYSNITTLRIENCSSAIPMMEILSEIPANSRVRLIGFTITASSTDDVEDFYDYLDTMRGLDENGNNVDTAQVQGVITGLGTITGTWLAEMNARYPYITIEYEHITSKLYYYNGSTLFYTENISDGGNGTYSGTPTKAQDAQYTYTFAGWSKDEDDNIVDANARNNVTADRNIYACYTGTLRAYTITWVNADSTVLETDTNVLYGTMPTYDGATPTYQGETATGWNPTVTTVTGDATYTAAYVEVAEITDSWDTIIANIDNGTYSSVYKIGNYKPLDLGTEGIINMQIVAMNADELASGGYAPLTFLGMELLNTSQSMGNNGDIVNWENSLVRNYLASTIFPSISSTIKSRIQKIEKYTRVFDENRTAINNYTTLDYLFIPSHREIFGYNGYNENNGVIYSAVFKSAEDRKKSKINTSAYSGWGLRTAFNSSAYRIVDSNGNLSYSNIGITNGVCLGFCLGYESETIEDD